LDAKPGIVAGALGAVATVFAASTGFDAEKGAKLHFIGFPVSEIDFASVPDEIEEGLPVGSLQVLECDGLGHVLANVSG
jgi:hypothetical protein